MTSVGLEPKFFPLFLSPEEKKKNVFMSVRAGDVNGYDSLLLCTTVVCGEGRAPEIPVTKSVRVN